MNEQQQKKDIKLLIDDFKLNYQKYKHFSEADVETKLVEELFIKVLGWSKADFNKQAKARRGERAGEADYAFHIEERIVFYLEVKRVGIPLDKEADKQVVSYALSKRVPFAVSTNFENLKIFCVEGSDEKDRLFRVFRSPDAYLAEFSDLMFLSKESFEKGFIAKKAEDEGRLRRRSSIDKSLLEDLMLIRTLIANDIERKYPLKYEPNQKDEIIQRIMDRLIFIRRSEDAGINPENFILTEITHLPDNKAYPKLKDFFKIYNDVYNSGLFVIGKDNDCDDILIDGAIIKKLVKYLYESKNGEYIYNFDWIDADVLGSVYEQYLGKILEQKKSGKSKLVEGQAHRKEQGIYYTPTYVVDYIVKNTVGEVLKSKKDPKQIRILDPACGSGSFLIKAFDYMYKGLANDDESKQRRLDSQGHYSFKTEILMNNIYGVDLDNQAVEITKLNLLLKASEPNRKLPEEIDLHIRQGNSLIDDEAVAGLNAFKWEDKFKDVMQEGGFDVVIGNPPYVRIQTLDDNSISFFNTKYKSATKNYDIYALFVEKCISLLKEEGVLGYILPPKFFNSDYGVGLRKVIADNKLLYKIVDFKDYQIFDGATTYTCLLFLKKTRNKSFDYFELSDKSKLDQTKNLTPNIFKKSKQEIPKSCEAWNFVSEDYQSIIKKLNEINLKLENISDNIFQGIITGADHIYILTKNPDGSYLSSQTEKSYHLEPELLHPLLKGSKHIRRYKTVVSGKYVIFPYKIENNKAIPYTEKELSEKFPNLYYYLVENKSTLQKRDGGKMKGPSWYLFSRTQNLTKFSQPKIMTPCIANTSSFTYDLNSDYFFVGSGGGGGGAYGVLLKDYSNYYYVLAILNSKLSEFFIKLTSSKFSGGFYAFNKQYIEKIPIVFASDKTDRIKLEELSKKQLNTNKRLYKFGTIKSSETLKLLEEIKKTDAEIDELVYKLYGITDDEKKIIEDSLK
ncbi:MAG: N-6 DNA methylase [archaeon]